MKEGMGKEGKGSGCSRRPEWGLGWVALAACLPAGARAGTPRHSHPGSAFGEGAAPLVGAGVMLMLHSGVCPRAVALPGLGTLPFPQALQGALVGNCSPQENAFPAAPHPFGLWEGLVP